MAGFRSILKGVLGRFGSVPVAPPVGTPVVCVYMHLYLGDNLDFDCALMPSEYDLAITPMAISPLPVLDYDLYLPVLDVTCEG